MRALYAAMHDNEGKSLMGDEMKKNEGDYLVVEKPEGKKPKYHLQVKKNGKLDARLLGAAHASLTVGFRGNKYEGPDKEKALSKLKKLYKEAGLIWPEDKSSEQKKSVSLFDLENKVHCAIREKMKDAMDVETEWDMPYCPIDVFVDFAIVKAPAGLYQIPYSIDAETYEVTLGEPQKVKIEYLPDDTPPMQDGEDIANPEDEMYKEMMAKSIEELSAVKSLGNDRVGAYAVLWGDETKKDLTGEFFDQNTEELTAIYDAVGKLPYLYHHAADENVKTSVIGVVDTLKPDAIGLWYEAQLRAAGDYDAYIKKLIEGKKLKTSTQTFAIARRVDEKSGHIERWPIVEITATPTPAEYRMQAVETLKAAYQDVGCTDFACVLKSKFGIEEGQGSTEGAEKAQMLTALEADRMLLLDF